MNSMEKVTFVVAVNDRDVLNSNFLASPCLKQEAGNPIILQEHFTSAARAYNDAIDKSSNDLIVFCHQDMFLPELWISDLARARMLGNRLDLRLWEGWWFRSSSRSISLR